MSFVEFIWMFVFFAVDVDCRCDLILSIQPMLSHEQLNRPFSTTNDRQRVASGGLSTNSVPEMSCWKLG